MPCVSALNKRGRLNPCGGAQTNPYEANVAFTHAPPRIPIPESPPLMRIFEGDSIANKADWKVRGCAGWPRSFC